MVSTLLARIVFDHKNIFDHIKKLNFEDVLKMAIQLEWWKFCWSFLYNLKTFLSIGSYYEWFGKKTIWPVWQWFPTVVFFPWHHKKPSIFFPWKQPPHRILCINLSREIFQCCWTVWGKPTPPLYKGYMISVRSVSSVSHGVQRLFLSAGRSQRDTLKNQDGFQDRHSSRFARGCRIRSDPWPLLRAGKVWQHRRPVPQRKSQSLFCKPLAIIDRAQEWLVGWMTSETEQQAI